MYGFVMNAQAASLYIFHGFCFVRQCRNASKSIPKWSRARTTLRFLVNNETTNNNKNIFATLWAVGFFVAQSGKKKSIFIVHICFCTGVYRSNGIWLDIILLNLTRFCYQTICLSSSERLVCFYQEKFQYLSVEQHKKNMTK